MKQPKTLLLTMTGLFAATITLMTAYILHIPYGANGGYIHVGDAFIYLAAVLLPRPYALLAGILGGGLADLLTAPMWAPFTIIAKALLVLPFTNNEHKILTVRNRIAPIIAMPITVVVYYIAEGILYGSFVTPMLSVFGNLVQGVGSAAIFYCAATALDKIHIKNQLAPILSLNKRS